MDAAGRYEPHQMKGSVVGYGVINCLLKGGDRGEFATFYGEIDARQTLIKNFTRADGEVADFRISHLPPTQTNRGTGSLKRHGRIRLHEATKYRHFGLVDSISV